MVECFHSMHKSIRFNLYEHAPPPNTHKQEKKEKQKNKKAKRQTAKLVKWLSALRDLLPHAWRPGDPSLIPRTYSEKSRLNHQKSSPDLTHALCIYTPTQDKFFLKKSSNSLLVTQCFKSYMIILVH